MSSFCGEVYWEWYGVVESLVCRSCLCVVVSVGVWEKFVCGCECGRFVYKFV